MTGEPLDRATIARLQDVVRLEQQLHDLMRRMTEVKRHAKYFSVPGGHPNEAIQRAVSIKLSVLAW